MQIIDGLELEIDWGRLNSPLVYELAQQYLSEGKKVWLYLSIEGIERDSSLSMVNKAKALELFNSTGQQYAILFESPESFGISSFVL